MASPVDSSVESAVRGGGLEWTVAGGDRVGLIGTALERWRDLEREPGAEIFKSNRMRTVLAVDPRTLSHSGSPGSTASSGGAAARAGRWIAKQYRHSDWPDRVRYRFVPSRAAREWHALHRLRELGFAAPRPLAFGERREAGVPVEGGLLMEEIPEAVSLEEELRAALAGAAPGELPARAAALLDKTGELVRALHDRGLDQPDLHPNNFLLSRADPEAIYIIDLHSARFRRRLSTRRRRAGLAKLAHSLAGLTQDAGLERLLSAYLGRSPAAKLERLRAAVARGARRIEERRIRSRSRRCLMPSTGFAVEKESGTRLYRRRELPREHLIELFRERAPGETLKPGARGWVARASIDGRGYLVKRRSYSIWESLRGIFEGHRLRRAFRAGFSLEVRGVATPRVLALREERVLGLARGAWLVTDWVADGAPLVDYLRDEIGGGRLHGERARAKHELARSAGELIRAVHEAGIYTQDLSPQNLIVSRSALAAETARRVSRSPGLPPDRSPARRAAWTEDAPAGPREELRHVVSLADLDSVHLWRRLGRGRRRRNLIQAGNMPEGHVSRSDRLRALRAYARGDATYLSRELIRELREGLLREAERTLERLLSRGRGR